MARSQSQDSVFARARSGLVSLACFLFFLFSRGSCDVRVNQAIAHPHSELRRRRVVAKCDRFLTSGPAVRVKYIYFLFHLTATDFFFHVTKSAL